MGASWIQDARRRLLDLRRTSGAWGYRRRTAPAVEASALAGLALLATDPVDGTESGREAARASAAWLASLRRREGALCITDALSEPGWATPFASLLWSAVGGFAVERKASLGWLLSVRGVSVPRTEQSPIGHDTTLIGWPWVDGTHSWVEPTALALLVLGREGRRDAPRAREGLRLLRDREIATGGWNYGNPAAFGTSLRPLPAPTGLALLALACLGGKPRGVKRALDYLGPALASTRAGVSLGWGILGLRAWKAAPEASGSWLADAYTRAESRASDETVPLALLLLAAGPQSLDVLGINPRAGRSSHG